MKSINWLASMRKIALIGVVFAIVGSVCLLITERADAAGLEKGYVSFTFDDGDKTLNSNVLPVLSKYSFPGTSYVVTDYVGDNDHITWDQVTTLQSKYGWEIGNHTKSHKSLIGLTDAEVLDQLQGAQTAFIAHDIKNVQAFAPPFGDFDSRTIALMKSTGFLTSSRQAWTEDDSFNTLDNFNPWQINVVSLKSNVTVSQVKTLIDEAVSGKKWLVLVIHQVTTEPLDIYQYKTTDLDSIASYASTLKTSGELDVVTVSKGYSLMEATPTPAPALTLTKKATPATYSAVGNVIVYSYTLKNSGNTVLSGPFSVTDNKVAVSCTQPADGALSPEESMNCTASYKITQADLDAKTVTNKATATNGSVTSNEATVTVTANVPTPAPAENLIKNPGFDSGWTNWNKSNSNVSIIDITEATSNQFSAYPGKRLQIIGGSTENIAYTDEINLSNSIDTYIFREWAKITLTSGRFGLWIDEFDSVGNYISGKELGGFISNTTGSALTEFKYQRSSAKIVSIVINIYSDANTSGTGLFDSCYFGTGSSDTTPTPAPALKLVKKATPTTYSAVGNVIAYSYTITNTGNVTLSGPFSVTDNKVAVSCTQPADGALSPEESMNCTASYKITQADLDAKTVTNKATATNGSVTSNETTVTVTANNPTPAPALTLTKKATPTTYSAVGNVIVYSYTLKNSGNTVLSGPFSVTDNKVTVSCTQPADGALSPAESMNCTASYKITQADLDAKSVTNKATATNGTVTSNEATFTVTAIQTPSSTLVQSQIQSLLQRQIDLRQRQIR